MVSKLESGHDYSLKVDTYPTNVQELIVCQCQQGPAIKEDNGGDNGRDIGEEDGHSPVGTPIFAAMATADFPRSNKAEDGGQGA